MDDGDILCDPELVLPYLRAFDAADARTGAERNLLKTEVIFLAIEEQMTDNARRGSMHEVRSLASVKCATDPIVTLGVATGTPEGLS